MLRFIIPALGAIAVYLIFGSAKANAMEGSNSINPLDRSTWPQGNRIWAIAQAIAIAEGYNVNGSVPNRFMNPGDLSPGDAPKGLAHESHDGSDVVIFQSHSQGWEYLYRKWERISRNASTVFPLSMTFEQAAQKYAGNWRQWVNNVVTDLQRQGYSVTQQTTLREFFA